MTAVFLSHRTRHWRDSWTYGDWRQYLCEHADGSTQCARISSAPYLAAILAGGVALTMALAMLTYPAGMIAWPKALSIFAVMALIAAFPLAVHLAGHSIMVSVGPRQYGNRRILPGETE